MINHLTDSRVVRVGEFGYLMFNWYHGGSNPDSKHGKKEKKDNA